MSGAAPFLTLIEPESLVRHFVAHPPKGFAAGLCDTGAPFFSTRFNVLTSVDETVRKRIAMLPLYSRWSHWLSPMSSFVGTTVSEYVVLPATLSPAALVSRWLRAHGRQHLLTIVKDIPCESPLICAAANRYAEELVRCCRSRGFVLIAGQALAYVRIDFESTDQYLARLSAARRKDLRRKLRSREALDIQRFATGSATLRSPDVVAELYELYLNVYRQSTVHFDLLSAEFFAAVLADDSSEGVVFTYRHEGQLIGYNLCFVHGRKLIDKYVGFRYPQARALNLYFVSWFQNLEYALTHGLEFYVAGWTDAEVKRTLGAQFTWTRHAVYVRNASLRALLRAARKWFESDERWLRQTSPDAPAHT
ncbi:MAG: GNAT family N-acetyltransferase [Gammaproteobacteria bacterium]